MRILLQNRSDSPAHPGGDEVVIGSTAKFLEERGHSVSVSRDPEPDLTNIDAVHLFNLTRPMEAVTLARHARRNGKPYVLTPIYWDLVSAIPWQAYEWPRSWRIRLTPDKLRYWKPWSGQPDERALQAETLEHARFVLSESNAERNHLLDRFGSILRPDRVLVSPHGVGDLNSTRERSAPAKPFTEKLICAGAIGPRKNQLGLVHALHEPGAIELQILGDAGIGCERYFEAVRNAANSNVSFRPSVPRSEIHDVLASFSALVQPSFVETPGLIALEARALGLPIVVSEFPPVREAFGEDRMVFYCDPGSVASIRSACELVLSVSRDHASRLDAPRKWSMLLEPVGDAYRQIEDDLTTSDAGEPY